MHSDVAELRDFYRSPLGKLVRRRLSHHIGAHWRGQKVNCLVGLGYALPYLAACPGSSRVGALMPDGQGALIWPGTGATRSVLVEEHQLPIPDNSVDRLIVTHCLEVAERVRPMLRELWRILSPEGRALFVVPNRRGVWSRIDTTPFGQGSPYSRGQLQRLLVDALFTPVHWASALYFPPVHWRVIIRSAPAIERIGSSIGPAFAGVLIVEVRKELVAPIGKASKARLIRGMVTARRNGGRPR